MKSRAKVSTSVIVLVMVSFILGRQLALSSTGDENWDSTFGVPGTDGPIDVVTVIGSKLYTGGYFTGIGGVNASNLAVWDGRNWSSLGRGVDGRVLALGVFGNDLYAGGFINQAGGIGATNIAKWDGTNWSSLGAGVDGPVLALAGVANELFAGGSFTSAGGGTASHNHRGESDI